MLPALPVLLIARPAHSILLGLGNPETGTESFAPGDPKASQEILLPERSISRTRTPAKGRDDFPLASISMRIVW